MAEGRVQQQGRWKPWKNCTMCAAQGAVLHTGEQEAQCLQVTRGTSWWSHHSAPPALSHWQNKGSLAHPAQAVTACLRKILASLVLTSSADTHEGRGSNSTGQPISIHPRAGHGAHLFDSLKHWLQPLTVDLTVTVQEGEDVSSCHLSSSHPRANQPYKEKRTAKEQED